MPAPVLYRPSMPAPTRYSVVVAKDYLKFAAAHFIAYPGFREPLHGHNYQVSVRVEAELGPEGYVLDFGLVKRVAKELCEELDERVLLPAESDCVRVRASRGRGRGDDGEGRALLASRRPTSSCCRSRTARPRSWPPICSAASARRSRAEVGGRGLVALEVGVAEAPGQTAYCRESF